MSVDEALIEEQRKVIAAQDSRIAELEAQLREARELAHIGGWTK